MAVVTVFLIVKINLIVLKVILAAVNVKKCVPTHYTRLNM